MIDKSNRIRRKIRQETPHGDRYDLGFTLLVFALAGVGIWLENGSAAIALVTAVTASVAIYRLRTPDNTNVPAVKPSFEATEDDFLDFGLRNYGPGPALYLQIEARLPDSDESLFEFGPREMPLHLSEGGFIGFIHDEQRPNDELRNAVVDITKDEGNLNEKVQLHYSYVSASGIRVPDDLLNEPERIDGSIEGLKDHSQKPAQMELREIEKHCLPKTEQAAEIGQN